MAASSGLGGRLQSVRKRRGLKQRELADASGVSLGHIRKLEQGERADTRLEIARKLAVALRVPTSTLVVDHDAEQAGSHVVDEWEPVRRALAGQTGQPEEAPTVEGVSGALAELVPIFRSDRYSEVRPLLPALLRDADALDDAGREVRARVLHLTGWLLTHTHQYEDAAMALQRALDDAPDRVEAAAIVNNQCWLLIRQGKLAECRQLATRWADDIEPRLSVATNEELAAWGWLLIRISTAAVRDNRPGEADDTLKLARAAAVRMGREIRSDADFLRSFRPAMVALKRAENSIIEDKPDVALAVSEHIPSAGIKPSSNNWNRHLLDIADANARLKRYSESFATMRQIRRNAPEWLTEQRYARDILGKLVKRRRTLTPEMRDMADFIRLPY